MINPSDISPMTIEKLFEQQIRKITNEACYGRPYKEMLILN